MEELGISVIKRAVVLDQNHKYKEALISYQEGIQILLNYSKSLTDEVKKTHFLSTIEKYITRAEELKILSEKENVHERINIENNSIGYSYETVFQKYLDSNVFNVEIKDPHIRTLQQCKNFLCFCELLVKCCENLKTVFLLTTEDSSTDQKLWLEDLKSGLKSDFKVELTIQYTTALHDREIVLSNGIVIKIDRGLDYFQIDDDDDDDDEEEDDKDEDGEKEEKLSISGHYDLDLCPCHKTIIEIFRKEKT